MSFNAAQIQYLWLTVEQTVDFVTMNLQTENREIVENAFLVALFGSFAPPLDKLTPHTLHMLSTVRSLYENNLDLPSHIFNKKPPINEVRIKILENSF